MHSPLPSSPWKIEELNDGAGSAHSGTPPWILSHLWDAELKSKQSRTTWRVSRGNGSSQRAWFQGCWWSLCGGHLCLCLTRATSHIRWWPSALVFLVSHYGPVLRPCSRVQCLLGEFTSGPNQTSETQFCFLVETIGKNSTLWSLSLGVGKSYLNRVNTEVSETERWKKSSPGDMMWDSRPYHPWGYFFFRFDDWKVSPQFWGLTLTWVGFPPLTNWEGENEFGPRRWNRPGHAAGQNPRHR